MKMNLYEFFKTRDFLFFRKMEKNLYLGVYFSSSKNGENANRNL
jgi:hypothetical protein